MADLPALSSTAPESAPPFVTAGPYQLRRVSAEFPDELLYAGDVGGDHVAWLKSINLLAGPWEWVIQQDGEPIDFSSCRFPTRTDAAADLVAALDVLIGPAPSVDVDEGPAAPMLVAAAAAAPGNADPDVLAMALDLAINVLQKARATFPAAAARAR